MLTTDRRTFRVHLMRRLSDRNANHLVAPANCWSYSLLLGRSCSDVVISELSRETREDLARSIHGSRIEVIPAVGARALAEAHVERVGEVRRITESNLVSDRRDSLVGLSKHSRRFDEPELSNVVTDRHAELPLEDVLKSRRTEANPRRKVVDSYLLMPAVRKKGQGSLDASIIHA